VVSDADLEKIQAQIDRYPDPGPDDEQAGYRQGLEDAARILQGLPPTYRG
jgi:hypothetical protein